MKKQLVLALSLIFSILARAEDCEVRGQIVVIPQDGGLALRSCERSMIGGLSAVGGLYADDLVEIMDQNKNDSEFFSALKSLAIGHDYGSAVQAVKDYAKTNGQRLTISGRNADMESLKSVGKKINDTSGVTQQIQAKADDRAETKRRKNEPIKMSMEIFSQLTESNKKIAKNLDPSNCRNVGRIDQKLKVLKVKFKDGEEGLIVPVGGKASSANTFEFSSPGYDKGLGGLQFAGKKVARKIRFENGKMIWVGINGKEYEIESFSAWTSQEGLGFVRPMNTPPGSTYDTCKYAELINGQEPTRASTSREGTGEGSAEGVQD